MLTTLEILKSAQTLLSKPGVWAKGWFAYTFTDDGEARRCWPHFSGARSFCIAGAVNKVGGPGRDQADAIRAAMARLDKAMASLFITAPETLAKFNDSPTTTIEMVLVLFDKAIELENDRIASPPLWWEAAIDDVLTATKMEEKDVLDGPKGGVPDLQEVSRVNPWKGVDELGVPDGADPDAD